MSALYRIFLKGLLTLLPISITIYLLVWIVTLLERLFSDPLRDHLPSNFGIPGVGVLLALVLIFSVGLLVNNYLTQKFVAWFEARLRELPVIKSIYSPLRDVTNLFASERGSGSQRVVMVQVGTVEMMGLITRDDFHDLPDGTIKDQSVAVFIPFSYGMGGFTVIVERSKIRETSVPADKAMQLAITGWVRTTPKN